MMQSCSQESVAIDCEDIEDWRQYLAGASSRKFLKLFTDNELAYCQSFDDPAPHLAVRWCAKEAVQKALNRYLFVDCRDLEVYFEDQGRPHIRHRKNGTLLQDFLLSLSLSHSRRTAMAVALVRKLS